MQFNLDENQQFLDVGEVITELSKLSQQNNDPKITELYYFDEPSGQFKWNEELIKSNS